MESNVRKGVLKKGEQWIPFSFSMMVSPAFRALSGKAMQLYLVARRQEASAKAHADRKGSHVSPDLYPVDKWECLEYTDKVKGRFPFYLNRALLVRDKENAGKVKPRDWYGGGTRGARLYADAKSLIEDRRKLVALGFFDEIPVGAGNRKGDWIKSVYVLSDRWRAMTEEEVERIKADLKKFK